MVRSNWKGALALTLAWAGTAGAQQPVSNTTAPGQPSERLMTVHEPGKPAQQCRVLSAQPLPEGGTALQIQSLATGEIFTLIEKPGSASPPAPPGPRPDTGKAFPASAGARPFSGPTAAPARPVGNPGMPPAPAAYAPGGGGMDSGDGGECHIVLESGRPPMRCRLLRRWHTPQGAYACQMQVIENGEYLTLIEEGPVRAAPGAAPGTRARAVTTRIFHWGRYKLSPPGAPLPPSEATPDIVVRTPIQSGPVNCCPPVIVQAPAGGLRGAQRPIAVASGPCNCCPTPDGMGDQGMPPTLVAEAVPVQQPRLGQRLVSRFHDLFGPRSQPSPAIQVVEMSTEPVLVQAPGSLRPEAPTGVVILPSVKPAPIAQAAPAVPPVPVKTAPAAPIPVKIAQAPPIPTPVPVRTAEVALPKPDPVPTAKVPPSTMAPSRPAPAELPQPDPIPTVRSTPVPVRTTEPAAPSDWRKSWDDTPAAKPTRPPADMPKPPEPAVAQAPPPSPPTALPRPPVSLTEKPKQSDPLLRPEGLASGKAEQALNGPRSATAPAKPAAPVVNLPQNLPQAGQPTTLPPMTATLPAGLGKVPLGAQSVLAATNGLDRSVQYVPVPIVTVPASKRPPLPPIPQMPQAPQPNMPYQNAFTPPQPPPDAQQGGQPGGAPGYLPPGGPMMGQRAMGPGSAPMMPPGGMMPGYPGYPPMMARPPMPGYGPMAQAQMPMYGYGPMPPGMYPPGAYGMAQGMNPYGYPPMGMPMQPPGRGTVPYNYQGPQPPNPFVVPPMQAPNFSMGQPRNTAMDRPAQSAGPAGMSANQAATNDSILEMIAVLKTSSYPSQREWAANNLASLDWRSNPVVVVALVAAAREDPAPTVRSGCVYNLARMRVNAEPVLATLRQLKSDSDPRVRVEAEQALARLNETPSAGPAAERNAVQPVRAVNP